MKMKWYSDSGHAWLEVERKELSRLKISKEISEYSYQHGTKVYLEEVCDANVFFKKYFENDEWFHNEIACMQARAIPVENCNGDSHVRNYKRYQA